MNEYYAALEECAKRYDDMVFSIINDNDYWGWPGFPASRDDAIKLWSFIKEFREGITSELPLMKLNRWLGYIQGTLIAWGKTTVQAERDWSRPLFRPLDFNAPMVE